MASIPFLTAVTTGTLRSNFSGLVGFRFVVGANNLAVTDLGRWVVSGNTATHVVTMYSGSTALATATITTSGASAGAFAYTAISTLTLTASQTYSCQSNEVSGGDQWYDDNTTVTADASLGSVNASIFNVTSTNSTGNHSYVPTNFKVVSTAANFTPAIINTPLIS